MGAALGAVGAVKADTLLEEACRHFGFSTFGTMLFLALFIAAASALSLHAVPASTRNPSVFQLNLQDLSAWVNGANFSGSCVASSSGGSYACTTSQGVQLSVRKGFFFVSCPFLASVFLPDQITDVGEIFVSSCLYVVASNLTNSVAGFLYKAPNYTIQTQFVLAMSWVA